MSSNLNTSNAASPVTSDPFASWKRKITEAKANVQRAKDRYYINMGLLVFSILLASFYYYCHLQPLLTQAIFVGVPLTGWVLFDCFKSWYPADILDEKPRALIQKLLAHPNAFQVLIFSAAVLCFAKLFTASVFLTHAGSADKAEIEVRSGTHPFSSNLAVSVDKPNAGNCYFLRLNWLRPAELEFRVVKPFGHRLKQAQMKLYPWSAVWVRFPTDFEPVNYRICRIIPGKKLNFVASNDTSYLLEIQYEGTDPIKLQGFSDKCYYLGESLEAIEHVFATETLNERRIRIQNQLRMENPDADENKLTLRATTLAENNVNNFRKSSELKPGTKVTAIVWRIIIGSPNTEVTRTKVTVPVEAGIFDIVAGEKP